MSSARPAWQDRRRMHDDGENGHGASSSERVAQLRPKARIVKLADQWFIACASTELGRDHPLAVTIQDVPLAIFRDERGAPSALMDRCPHRNVPLSCGRVARDGTLECAYHGWRFDREGTCRAIPSFVGEPGAKGRAAQSFPVIEQDGWIWVYSTPYKGAGAEMPASRPYRFLLTDTPGYTSVRQTVTAEATMYSTLENALDVPHTAFLHRGLFRSDSRGISLRVKVRRTRDRVEAEYLGEPRPPGIVAKILSPSGGIVTHFDRFILPSIAQVEYRIGDENHFLADSVATPVSDFVTKLHAVVSFKSRLPGHLIAPVVKPLALRVFQQDAGILRRQTESVKRFGGEQFASTEIDVLGAHIWRLLKSAERGEPLASEEESELSLVV
jgi:phenylpropionate dioxygenase-like ring-hydroxylating dioxygenase large terminal subunit